MSGSTSKPEAAMGEARFDLGGTVILVTGASRGLGRELAMLLAQTGAVVVPTCRTTADIESLEGEAADRGLTVRPTLLDVRDATSIASAANRVVAAHGTIDVLVNNAGLGWSHPAAPTCESVSPMSAHQSAQTTPPRHAQTPDDHCTLTTRNAASPARSLHPKELT